jgi:hypothetical protein
MKLKHWIFTLPVATLAFGCASKLPPPQTAEKVVYLDQGWSETQRQSFYFRPQGTSLLPMSWLLALEQPESRDLLSDHTYLNRLGFITDDIHSGDAANAHALPVGFASFVDPESKVEYVGFGCAACHTGQLNYKGRGVRIDGGAPLQNIYAFQADIASSIIATWVDPLRYDRFARRVLKERYDDRSARDALRATFQIGYDGAKQSVLTAQLKKLYPSDEGFARLDALQRIANTLTGDDLKEPSNYQVANGPVSYPHLWDISKFDWVQYNGSVRQPMARNVGEALGVNALTHFVDADGRPVTGSDPYRTSVMIDELNQSELDVRGLTAPRWPTEVFGPLDGAKAAQGRQLYQSLCADCHAPRPIAGSNHEEWQLPVYAFDVLGTDRNAAENFIARSYDVSKLGIQERLTSPQALFVVTQKVKDYQYDHHTPALDAAERQALDGYGVPNALRAPCGYRARPLDGVWATAPFLHNGSVPNLYQLLSPVSERSSDFWVGNREFDPVHVGYVSTKLKGATHFDTTLPGNSNRGHEFSDTKGMGVIGRGLTPDERMALIEYFKSLPDPEPITRTAGQDTWPCQENGLYWTTATP